MRRAWLPFVGPFAVLGAVGGWLTLETLCGGGRHFDAVALCLVGITPLTAALLGGLLARYRHRWKLTAACFPVVVIAAGAVNGVSIGLAVSVEDHSHAAEVLGVGAMMGGFCGAFFLLPMLWTYLSAVRIGRAREGSLLDPAQRRAPWGAAAASCSIAVWAARAPLVGHAWSRAVPDVSAPAGFVLTAGVVAVTLTLAADVRALSRLLRRARLATMRVEWRAGSHEGDILDLGLGDELFAEEGTEPVSMYRAAGFRVTRMRGSVMTVKRKLADILVVDLLATGTVLLCAAHLALLCR